MQIRTARILFASLAFVALFETSIIAAGADSPPHVDTSGVNLQPPYPQTAMQTLERGAPLLGVAVTAEGRVTRVTLIETSGFNDLDASAISTVLGWKFVPAMKDGSPVEGMTMVKLVFEPPAASPNATSAQQPPPSSQPLFPVQMPMNALDKKKEARDFAVPCRQGAFEGVVTIKNDAKNGGEMVAFEVELRARSESAYFVIHHVGARLIGASISHGTNGAVESGSNYWGSGELNVPIPISVGWGSARVIGNGGIVFGQHQVGFSQNPEKLQLAVYSGDVMISNARLVCLPDHS